jgi:hypothetical protein
MPGTVVSDLQFDPILPATVCHPDHPEQCYRISGREQVEYSGNGGNSWRTGWRIPYGREHFMQRTHLRPLSCKYFVEEMTTQPLDIALVKKGSDYVAVVAMGNEGVLTLDFAQDWNRYAVGNATPSPFLTLTPWSG